jgi:hypothetical protein
MSGLVWLGVGLIGQMLLGAAAAAGLNAIASRWSRTARDTERNPSSEFSHTSRNMPWPELIGLGLVLGIGLTAWCLFVWSLCGGILGRGASLLLTAVGFVSGAPVVWQRLRAGSLFNAKSLRQHSASGKSHINSAEDRREEAFCRLCQWLIALLTGFAFIQTLLTPQHFWDERSIFAIKGLALAADGTIHSADLHHPDFVQYHPRYPLLIPLAEQHIYALLGGVDDRLSKLAFPLLYLGLVLCLAGVLTRHVKRGAAWLFALLLASIPVLMPYELGFTSGQADAPMACFHGLAMLYLWDACATAPNRGMPGATFLAGICGALAAFTKDEGIAFLLVDVTALSLLFATRLVLLRSTSGEPLLPPEDASSTMTTQDTATTGRLDLARPSMTPTRSVSEECNLPSSLTLWVGVVVGCAVIMLAPWFIHRRGLPLTTEMNYFGRASLSLMVERLPVLVWEAAHLGHRMFWEWYHWGLHWWLLLAGLAIAPRRAFSVAQVVLLLDVFGSLLALMIAGMLAPAQLDEHIGGSSPRFLMQLVPVAVLFAAGQLAPRRESGLTPHPDRLV